MSSTRVLAVNVVVDMTIQEPDPTTNQTHHRQPIMLQTPKVLGEGQATNPIRD